MLYIYTVAPNGSSNVEYLSPLVALWTANIIGKSTATMFHWTLEIWHNIILSIQDYRFQWDTVPVFNIKDDYSVKEAPAYCRSFFDGLHTWKGGGGQKESLFYHFKIFLVIFGGQTYRPTDWQTDLGIKGPSRSIKNTVCKSITFVKISNLLNVVFFLWEYH